MSSFKRSLVVLGLGNILHSDDGAGPRAVGFLKSHPRLPPGVVAIDGGTLGLELLPQLWDCSDLLVLDAIDVGRSPGTVVRVSGDELSKLACSGNVHQLGVGDLLVAMRVLAHAPPEVVLFGIQPETVEWGGTLSTRVQAGLNLLVEATLAELERLSAAADNGNGVKS